MVRKETKMPKLQSVALSVVCLALSASSIQAQDLSRYREVQFGMTLAAVAEQVRLTTGAARLLHQRPQLIQELDWLPQQQQPAGATESEAVRIVRFTFYDGRLCRIAVEYDRDRVEGLTAGDFVQAISAAYGLAVLASTQIGGAPPTAYGDLSLGSDRTVAAQWEAPPFSVSLVRTSHPSAFELLLLERQPDQRACAATLASTRLELAKAMPTDVTARQEPVDQDRGKMEKARGVNRLAFRF
jgi:hypothetical protein